MRPLIGIFIAFVVAVFAYDFGLRLPLDLYVFFDHRPTEPCLLGSR